MRIDIYARRRNQTGEEGEKQITGFTTLKGDVGYLREAHHGDPYATRHFVSEAFPRGGYIKSDVLLKMRSLNLSQEWVGIRTKRLFRRLYRRHSAKKFGYKPIFE